MKTRLKPLFYLICIIIRSFSTVPITLFFRWAFKMYDTDNSGKIEVKEMVNVMKVGNWADKFSCFCDTKFLQKI